MIRTSCILVGLGAMLTTGCNSDGDPEELDSGNNGLSSAGTGNTAAAVAGAANEIAEVAPAASCAQRTADELLGVFVRAEAGSDVANCGGRSSPCKTITKGLERANGLKSLVYVANGIYMENVALIAGIRVEGGWSVTESRWTPDCNPDATRISSTGASIVTARDLAGATSLAYISVENQTVAIGNQSLYGVFARGMNTNLTLEDVRIAVADAGNGSDGKAGAYGSDGSVINPAGCAAGDGNPGVAPDPAVTDALPGTFGSDGYVPGDGLPGASGNSGHNGTAPTLAPTCVRSCMRTVSSTVCTAAPESCGTVGKPGCGGGGGKGGGPGLGGGSSIALYVWDATVTVRGGRLEARDGGRGGIGAPGGRGGDGGIGVPGTSAANACTQCTTGTGLGSSYYTGTVEVGRGAGGGPGGDGGVGTDGLPGGDGSGGYSYAIYRNRAGLVTLLDTPELLHGAPGGTTIVSDPGDARDIGGPQ